jgi:arsenate reductase
MSEPIKVLFVCVHNSARSQMAAALLHHLGGSRFVVESAGFDPRPANALAIEAMRHIGIDISSAKSQVVFDLYRAGNRYDYVISVCDAANGERCPIFPGVTRRIHWSFADPATFTGNDDEQLRQVVALREEILVTIESWLRDLLPTQV